jgi:hypothetical protein
MKRQLRFGGNDAAGLSTFKPKAAPRFAEITDALCDRIREHHDADAVQEDETQIECLKGSRSHSEESS